MNELEISKLVKPIPEGKKREYLDDVYIKGLTNYFNEYIGNEIEYNSLVVSEFKKILNSDNDLIKHLKLFSKERLDEILKSYELDNLSSKKIRQLLIEYCKFDDASDSYYSFTFDSKSKCENKLHDFQERIRRKVINMMFSENKKRFLIHMPTGSGKTRTASEIIIDFIRFSASTSLLNEKIKIIWIAQSSELCEQAFSSFKDLYDVKGTTDLYLGSFFGKNEIDSDIIDNSAIIFTSIQKLLMNYETDVWKKIRNDNYLVIVDEAHRSVASEWVKALDFFVKNRSVNLIGLTATPGAGTNNDMISNYLSSYYNNNKISLLDEKYSFVEKPISYLVNEGFLAEIERNDIESEITIENGVKFDEHNNLKVEKKTLNTLSTDAKRNQTIIDIIEKHINEKHKILVFTCGTNHNFILKNILAYLDVYSEVIDASTKDRFNTIENFKNGNLDVLLNYGVLTTGFDAPKTNVCIIARPVESIVMYSQMVGRILRGPKNGKGNKKNTLYTIKDNLNHGDYDKLFNSFNEFWN